MVKLRGATKMYKSFENEVRDWKKRVFICGCVCVFVYLWDEFRWTSFLCTKSWPKMTTNGSMSEKWEIAHVLKMFIPKMLDSNIVFLSKIVFIFFRIFFKWARERWLVRGEIGCLDWSEQINSNWWFLQQFLIYNGK